MSVLWSVVLSAWAEQPFAPASPEAPEVEPDPEDIEVVVVTSDLREEQLALEVPSSITVLQAQGLRDEGGAQLEDVMYAAPNLNWSGATSRPRYFQIRGIGDQEEYQGAPNPSVGFLIDDIDLSGLGMAATLYDVQQIEVLRGPQGTRYGANALAGLIYLKSNDPTPDPEGGAELSLGTDDAVTIGAYGSGPLTEDQRLMMRASLQVHQQDGFRDNTFLDRSDTNGRNEQSARVRLRWIPLDDLRIDLTYLHANLDNGYDAWTLDNNGFETRTDKPGVDSQRTHAGSARVTAWLGDVGQLTSLTTVGQTRHRHAYDGDWANPSDWAEKTCEDWETGAEAPCEYDYTWDKRADRLTASQELRLSSADGGRLFGDTTDWLLGLYVLHNREHNDLDSFYNGYADVLLVSDFASTNLAGFADVDSRLGPVEVSVGARVEHRRSAYEDDAGEAFDPRQTMLGGHLTVMGRIGDHSRPYVRFARGYKAGGFNMGLPSELSAYKTFDGEFLHDVELGYKGAWLDGDLTTTLAAFLMDRSNQQVQASLQDPDNPQRFFLYTDTAGRSTSMGGEIEVHARPHPWLELDGSLGLLNAAYAKYSIANGDGTATVLDGRELAHAPTWTGSLVATVRAPFGLFARVSGSGMDRFYYSDRADFESKPYAKLNAKVGYERRYWQVYLWARNLLDARYGVRGFYFGNDPSTGWAEAGYVRYGDPRQVGLTVRLDLR